MRRPDDRGSLGTGHVNGKADRAIRSGSPLTAIGPLALGAIVVIGTLLNLPNPPGLLAFVPYAVVGSTLVIRRRGQRIGWLLLLMAVLFSVVGRGIDVTNALAATSWEHLLAPLAWLGTMAGVSLFAGMATLSAVFPSGVLPAGAIGRWSRGGIVLIGLVALLQAVVPDLSITLPDGRTITILNPIGIAPDWPGWVVFDGAAPYLVVLAGLVICVAGLLLRFRRAAGVEREQDKWLLASLALVAAAVLFGFVAATTVNPEGTWAWFPALLAFPLPPIAIGIAVMRYRLFDIDRIISRTIGYASVTLVLFAIFAGVNLTLQSVFEAVIGGGSVAVAASTLAVAALFNPLRGRLQRVVDRRFNRAGRSAELTVDRFAGRLRDQLDLETLGDELKSAAVSAVEPATATFWLRPRKAVRR